MDSDCGHDHSSDDGEHMHILGMGPVPAGIAALMRGAGRDADREVMEIDDMRNRMNDLLMDLTPDQLITVRHMLGNNHEYMDGMVVGALLYHHKVDPMTGLKLEERILDKVPDQP